MIKCKKGNNGDNSLTMERVYRKIILQHEIKWVGNKYPTIKGAELRGPLSHSIPSIFKLLSLTFEDTFDHSYYSKYKS
jgi:hypothetical protein